MFFIVRLSLCCFFFLEEATPVLYALKTSSFETCVRDFIDASLSAGSASSSLSSPSIAAASAASSWPSKNFNAAIKIFCDGCLHASTTKFTVLASVQIFLLYISVSTANAFLADASFSSFTAACKNDCTVRLYLSFTLFLFAALASVTMCLNIIILSCLSFTLNNLKNNGNVTSTPITPLFLNKINALVKFFRNAGSKIA
mmetsp:Transcript_5509/g.20079  ORF Transcript_5509/g.20079 Transcript_5509/m.20079 type:complete len:200 (+) Transcript_5509:1478-2077(+)